MRIEIGYYNEYIKVTDPCAFSLFDIQSAANRVYWEAGDAVQGWPITIEFNERTEQWEVYFLRPLGTDENMQSLPEDV